MSSNIVCYYILIFLIFNVKQSSSCENSQVKSLRQRRLEKRQVTNARNVIGQSEGDKKYTLLQLQPNEDAFCYSSLSLATSLLSSSSSSSSSLPLPPSLSPVLITDEHIKFYSFDDIFGSNVCFSELFNSNSDFRKDLRIAARNDFFVKDETITNEMNNLLKDPRSSMSSSWGKDTIEYPSLTNVFQKYKFSSITGKVFISELTKLCPDTPNRFNSWMDIIGVKNKAVNHSWHQDSGLFQKTVMVGFPPQNNYEGLGNT